MMKSNLFSLTRMMALAIGMMYVTGVCAQNTEEVAFQNAPVHQSQREEPIIEETPPPLTAEKKVYDMIEIGSQPEKPISEPAVLPPPPPAENKVYDIVEIQPQFPGGKNAFSAWLARNVYYPSIAQENGIQGTVVVSFIVEKDGSVTDVKVARGKDPSLDKEAVRVISCMPKWIPGRQNNQLVRVRCTTSVAFNLQ